MSSAKLTKKEKLLKAIKDGKIKDDKSALLWILKQKGKDELIKEITPKLKGEKGEKGDSIKGDKGEIGKTGIAGKQGLEGIQGIQGIQGEQGLEGSPDSGEEIVDKINILPVKKEFQIDSEHIFGLDKLVKKTTNFIGGGSVARSFYQLFDTPENYASKSGYYPRVNTGETGLEFFDLKTYIDNAVSGENLWDRSGTTLEPHTANDNLDIGSGDFDTTGIATFGGIIYADAVPLGLDVLYSAEIGNHLIVGNNLTVGGTISGNLESVDDHDDVDTTTSAPELNEVLKWDGSNFVPTAYDYTFVFSIASFTDNEATTQLIGSGEWEATGAITFGMTYNNPPPTAVEIILSSNGGVSWGSNLTVTTPFTSATSAEGTDYPGAKDQYITFTLDADKGAENDTDTETVYFRNKVFWGVIAKASGLTEADVEGLSGSAITNDFTRSQTINAGAGEYIVLAYPTSYTAMNAGSDYEDDGGTSFKFNSIAIAMTQDNAALSITNSAGYTENYDVYISDVANLGNHTFTNTTAVQSINPLYYGKTTTTSGYSEADVEGLATNEITNDNTQTWDSITTGATEYMLFAFPKRLGIPTFWVGGFEGGFESPETVSVTNTNGWTEDYYVWRSTNSNLGATVVVTQ